MLLSSFARFSIVSRLKIQKLPFFYVLQLHRTNHLEKDSQNENDVDFHKNDENVVNITTSYETQETTEREQQKKEFQEWQILKTKREEIEKQLPEEVVKYAKSVGLSNSKLELLNHKRLKKEHPEFLKSIIGQIEDKSDRVARDKIAQKVIDIETGYIVKEGNNGSYVYSGKDARDREIIKSNTDKIIDLPPAIELDIVRYCNRIIFLITGRALTRGETEYTKEIIDKNKERRYKIVKSCDGNMRELNNLYEPLTLAKHVITDMLAVLMMRWMLQTKNKN